MSRNGRRVVRYSLGERVVHSAAAMSYVYLLLTGLAFWTPGLYWIAMVLGGGYLSRALHPWAGLVFAAIVARMFVMWQRDMRTTDADRLWRRAMAAYIRNDDLHVPAAGRFNFGQKQLFWLMVLGAAGCSCRAWCCGSRRRCRRRRTGCSRPPCSSTPCQPWRPSAVSSCTSTWAWPWSRVDCTPSCTAT